MLQRILSAPVLTTLQFYLGTHHPVWLERVRVPLFISNRRLMRRKRLPRAIAPWALDSGGFTELTLNGRWTITAREYVQLVRRYIEEIGLMEWAAIQDWMCEEQILRRTRLSVAHHQLLTLHNYFDLLSLAPGIPWMPVIQGFSRDEYLRHADMYEGAGVDLASFPRVGLGSVCRRQGTEMARRMITTFTMRGYRVHGFGLKTAGLKYLAGLIESADSLAWSYGARYKPPLAGHTHKHCGNCLEYALEWRARMLRTVPVYHIHTQVEKWRADVPESQEERARAA